MYDTGWVPPGRHWNPFSEMSRSMQPAVDLRLGPRVLLDRNSVELRYRLRPWAGRRERAAGTDRGASPRDAAHGGAGHAGHRPGVGGSRWSTCRRGSRGRTGSSCCRSWKAGATRRGRACATGARRPTPTGWWCRHWRRFGCGGTGAARRWRSTTGSRLPWAARGAVRVRVRIRAWSAERKGARSRCNWDCGVATRCSCSRWAASSCRRATD